MRAQISLNASNKIAVLEMTIRSEGVPFSNNVEIPNKETDEIINVKTQCKPNMLTMLWNCQEMCSRGIPKIMDRQESGGVMRELL